MILDYINYNKNRYYKRGARLSENVLDFFYNFKIPEAYTILYTYWEEDGKARNSDYFTPLLYMNNPETIAIIDKEIDSVIALNNTYSLYRYYDYYVKGFLLCEHSADWMVKLLKTTAMQNIDFTATTVAAQVYVPFNTFIITPYSIDALVYNKHIFAESGIQIVDDIIESLYKDYSTIRTLKKKQLLAISKQIIEHYDEFATAAQPFRTMLQENCECWKKDMPYRK